MGYLGEADPASWPEERKAEGRAILSTAHRGLLAAAPLGLIALPTHDKIRDLALQALALVLVVVLATHAFASDENPFWPLAVAIPVIAALRLRGGPNGSGVLGFSAFVVGSVCITHAVFFGEDRYHVVATPALCLLAACALGKARAIRRGSGARAS
jgi:hypothetical protein